jgi:hypothetical protein
MLPVTTSGKMSGGEAKDVRSNFRWMTLCFAVNHSCATAPIVYASSVLVGQVGFIGNGTLYAMSIVSSLLLSVLAIDIVGLKGGLLLGTTFYSVYVGSFTLAALFTGTPALQYLFFVGGSAAGGLAAGILWTAEGGYMARCATQLADIEITERQSATAELAADFGFYYLILEVVGKLGFSFLQAGLSWQPWQIGLLYCSFAVIAMLALTCIDAVPHGESPDAAKKSPFSKLAATVQLWKDPKIWLLSPTNITFGFSAAYLNGYFNFKYEKPDMGVMQLGTLTSITVLCAAMLTKVYGKLGQSCGKGAAIAAGAVSFGSIPILVLTTDCCADWGWAIVIFYVLQGSGRAVYESTNKAVFSDFFTGADTEGAFANCSLQMSVASAVLFFTSGKLTGPQLAIMVMVSASLTPFVYAASSSFKGYGRLVDDTAREME